MSLAFFWVLSFSAGHSTCPWTEKQKNVWAYCFCAQRPSLTKYALAAENVRLKFSYITNLRVCVHCTKTKVCLSSSFMYGVYSFLNIYIEWLWTIIFSLFGSDFKKKIYFCDSKKLFIFSLIHVRENAIRFMNAEITVEFASWDIDIGEYFVFFFSFFRPLTTLGFESIAIVRWSIHLCCVDGANAINQYEKIRQPKSWMWKFQCWREIWSCLHNRDFHWIESPKR